MGWKLYGAYRSSWPIGPRKHSGNDVCDIEKRCGEKDLFHALVVAFDHNQPDDGRRNGHADELGDVKKFHGAGHAGELRHYVGEVRRDQNQHHYKGDAQAIFFADQIAEAFAGARAHARGHLLHHNQRKSHGNDGPEKGVAELRAGERVGVDATGIIVNVGGNKSRADYCQKQQGLGLPALEPFHWTRTYRNSLLFGRINESWNKEQPGNKHLDKYSERAGAMIQAQTFRCCSEICSASLGFTQQEIQDGGGKSAGLFHVG